MGLLERRLKQDLANGGVVELRKTYLAMTTDTLADHTFQKPLDLLKSDQKANDWRRTIKAVAVLTPLIKQFTWIIPLALKLPLRPLQMVVPDLARIVALRRVSREISFCCTIAGRPVKEAANMGVVQDMNMQADAAIYDRPPGSIEKATPPPDIKSPKSISIFESILASKGLSAKEKETDRLAQEGFVVLVAGGETTARVLTTATYHLLASKGSAVQKLKEELATIMVEPDTQVPVKVLEQLPWLVCSLPLLPAQSIKSDFMR